jgi:predicted ester cyclase
VLLWRLWLDRSHTTVPGWNNVAMDTELANAIADGYERWAATGDQSVLVLFSPTFIDNVSGQRGLVIFEVVGRWLEESVADRHIEHHATIFDGDKVMVWYTQHGRHVGNGFPRLRGCAVTGAQVRWTQVHVCRVEAGKIVEHWAVRDDFAMLEQINLANR